MWSLADTDKTALLRDQVGRVELFHPGSSDALDALTLWIDPDLYSGGPLAGGGLSGRLTPLGFQQSMDLGKELRARKKAREGA